MKKPRKLSVLLSILLNNMDKLNTGLCLLTFDLSFEKIISNSEYCILLNYLSNNPKKGTKLGDYWYPAGKKKPRIRILKYRIKVLQKKGL